MPPVSVIRPSATYTVAEVACMLGQSNATIRRLIDRRHLARAPGIAAVRITHGSVEALLRTGAMERIDLRHELKQNGPCLVLDPEAIASMYKVHVQTVYRLLSRGVMPTVHWLWCRRVLKSEVSRILGNAATITAASDLTDGKELAGWIRRDTHNDQTSPGTTQTFYWSPPMA